MNLNPQNCQTAVASPINESQPANTFLNLFKVRESFGDRWLHDPQWNTRSFWLGNAYDCSDRNLKTRIFQFLITCFALPDCCSLTHQRIWIYKTHLWAFSKCGNILKIVDQNLKIQTFQFLTIYFAFPDCCSLTHQWIWTHKTHFWAFSKCANLLGIVDLTIPNGPLVRSGLEMRTTALAET